MHVLAKSKVCGEKDWGIKKIILPDHCTPYFEKYMLEIVEYRAYNCMGLFFRKKDGQQGDALSYTIHKPGIQSNIVDGFRMAMEELEALDASETPLVSETTTLSASVSGFNAVETSFESVTDE